MGAIENSLGERLNRSYTVKKDGTGDYMTIQEGINGIPEGIHCWYTRYLQ